MNTVRMTLARKLLFYTGSMIALLLLVAFLVLERSQAQAWEDHLFSQSLSFAKLATPELLKRFRGSFPPDEPADIAGMHEFLALNRDLARFSLVAASGRRLYASEVFPGFETLPVGGLLEENLAGRLAARRTTVETRVLADGRRVLDLLEPVSGPTGENILSVRFLISYDSVDARVADVRSHFVFITFGAILLCLLFIGLIARWISRPITALTAGARSIARGELGTSIPPASRDEIGTLAQAFNDMARSLSANQEELTRKNNELRRANEDLHSMQDQLLRSERLAAIGQLAAGVSHEIDNPVGIILGHAELLYEDFDEEDPRREDIKLIIDECRRCKRITGGLLGFSRRAEGERTRVDLESLVKETVASLKPQKLFKSLDIELPLVRGAYPVRGDADQLRQVLINILLNAAQALGGTGTVRVSLAGQDGQVRITIDDSGPGIPDADREKIFQPFFSTKAHGEGTGLGLALCRKLLEDHGGDLYLVETTLGGACFELVLPALETEKNFDKFSENSLG